jgi:hypothetical protein
LKFGAWNFSGAWRLVLGAFCAGAALMPADTLACATCYGGNIQTPMTDGMNWGIFTLMGVIGTVLATFLTFFIYLFRKSAALAAAAGKAPESLNV